MREERVSLRGKLVRDMMKNMMDSAMGHKFQTGEYRMNPVEPAWICPSEYEYEIVEMEKFQMEFLRPTESARVALCSSFTGAVTSDR